MTIITKPISDKNAQKSLGKPLLINIPNDSVSKNTCDSNGDNRRAQLYPEVEVTEAWFSPSIKRRVSTTTTVCVFITALLVMSIGIIGGVYWYRRMTHHQSMSRFRGWCGVPFERNSLQFHLNNRPSFKETWMPMNSIPSSPHSSLFMEEFDLDLASDFYEDIRVPDFGYGRDASFLHDFKENKTAIVDYSGKRCFIMPLDREHIKPPKNLFQLIRTFWLGYYGVDMRVVRRRMKVVVPPIKHLSTEGTYISRACSNFTTYLLKEKLLHDRFLRDVSKPERDENKEFIVAEFAGKGIMEYVIEDQ